MYYIKPDDIFAVNNKLAVEVVEIEGARVVTVDNFYQNPQLVRDYILTTPAPIWKTQPGGKNFVDYYDCRHNILVNDAFDLAQKTIAAISRKYLNTSILKSIKTFNTNVFQLIKNQPDNAVAVPHEDGQCLAALVGLNTPEECHGGTAFYKSKFNGISNVLNLTKLEREAMFEWMEDHALFEKGDDYFLHHWQDYWELVHVVEMKYNRLSMYNGPIFHGAYHVDNHFKGYPRINHQMFFDVVKFNYE
jgi:hypothetical protein